MNIDICINRTNRWEKKCRKCYVDHESKAEFIVPITFEFSPECKRQFIKFCVALGMSCEISVELLPYPNHETRNYHFWEYRDTVDQKWSEMIIISSRKLRKSGIEKIMKLKNSSHNDQKWLNSLLYFSIWSPKIA